MSAKELSRVEVMERLKAQKLTQREAAGMLGVSVRQVKRLVRRYRKKGAAGLASLKRGRPSNHQLPPELRPKVVELIRARYPDFGPTLAWEKIAEVHHLHVSREKVRQWMIEEGLWQPKHAKKPVVHPLRPRRACLGELVQIDGSPHPWFEDRAPACTLIVFIDDATGRLQELLFVEAETTFAYFTAMQHYLERNGKPVAVYSDKHGIFRVNQPHLQEEARTQFGRAMDELRIEIICANTAQAKGRVERANQTLQDRLVKELRLRGISTLPAANAYAPEFREDFNRRFAVAPASPHDAHRPLTTQEDLARLFTKQDTRTLSKNLTFQYDHVLYQVQAPRGSYAFRQAQVKTFESADGRLRVEYKDRLLPCVPYQEQPHHAEITSSKEVDAAVDSAKTERQPHRPSADHPWRRPWRRANKGTTTSLEGAK
jgi:transposase